MDDTHKQALDDVSIKHQMPPATIALATEDSMVTLEEGEQEQLILCPVENPTSSQASPSDHRMQQDTTFTYASLDDRGNIVLQPLKNSHSSHVSRVTSNMSASEEVVEHANLAGKEAASAQLVVVGEGVDGDTMAYIYIQGDDRETDNPNEMDVETTHTITLNSADGSTLQTLPASYTQHLEHAYEDLVLVNSEDGAPEPDVDRVSNNLTDIPPEEGNHDDPLLLFSVEPIKLEEQNNLPAISQSSSSHEMSQQRTSKVADASILLDNVMSGNKAQESNGSCLGDQRLIEEETATIEERLATRDSLLPPKRHRRSKSHVCPICQMTFKSNYQFNTHQALHQGHNMWACDHCKFACETLALLKLHKKSAHQDIRPYKCHQCELRFPKSPMLEDHIRSVHYKERPYSCSFCSKGFYRPHDLKMHLNLHLGIKSNVCHVCGRQFSHPSNLIRHQRLHTGVKPYVCPTCGRRFTQLILLHKHRTTHQPGAGVCPQCPATFRSAAGLKKHYKFGHKKSMTLQEATRIVRGHGATVGRRYYCQVCGDQFLLKADLKKHEQKEHTSGTELHCPSCDKTYTASTIKYHICISAEEEKRNNPSLEDPPIPHLDTSTSTNIAMRKPRVKEGKIYTRDMKAETEEYLVMYFTPEGESISYVMKKGEEGTLDKVLQINAPIQDSLSSGVTEETLQQRPALAEETIMINVQDRPILGHHPEPAEEEQSLMTLSSQLDENVSTLSSTPDAPNAEDATMQNSHLSCSESLTLPSIKVEPQASDGTLNIGHTAEQESQLLPILELGEVVTSSTPKTERKAGLRNIAIMRNLGTTVAVKSENQTDIKGKGLKSESEGGTSLPPLTCEDCGKTFQKRWNYQQHIATHDASLHRYKCDICDLTFAYRSTYTGHMKKHSIVQTIHACPLCPKTYQSKISLNQHHKREHLRLRPYVCNLCQKDFYSKGDYKYHMRIHAKENPYICFACGRDFCHLSHLHRHERTHTKERPHKCPFCPKEFIQLVTLRIHLKKHEKEVAAEHILRNADRSPDAKTDVNLSLGHDLAEDSSRIVSNATENLSIAENGGLLVTEDRGGADKRHTHDPSSADISKLRQSIVNENTAAEGSTHEFSPGTIFMSQEEEETSTQHQFANDPTAVVTGMDGDCIAIFVQENLN